MINLKNKTLYGLSWSFIDSFANQGITFVVGIVLARLIEPAEFGILGMIAFFMAVSSSFIDSGFGSALIRKNNVTQEDYSTVFYFNIATSVFFYILLFSMSPFIAIFFGEPRLTTIMQISGLSLVISSFALVQRVRLTKNIDFKTQAKITIFSSVVSGVIAIFLAYKGFGVWALVWRSLVGACFVSLFHWLLSDWRPLPVFSRKSFSELFGFGSRLLVSGLIETIYKNIYYPIIGKFFSPATLGFYTRAESFSSLFSSTLTDNIQRVSYPVLSSIREDKIKLKVGYRKIIKNTMLLTFTLMLGLAAVSKSLILILIGEKWLPCVPYLQLLCFSSMLYPLHAINLNAINVQGRSDLFLKLEIIKKIFAVPVIFAGIYWGIEALLVGKILISFIAYFMNSYYSGTLIRYSTKEQIKDIAPDFCIALNVAFVMWLFSILNIGPWLLFFIQCAVGIGLLLFIHEKIKLSEYEETKQIALYFIINTKNKWIHRK